MSIDHEMIERLAHEVNRLCRIREMIAAVEKAEECVTFLMKSYQSRDVEVHICPREEIGVANDCHLVIALEADKTVLLLSKGMVQENFSNLVHRFKVIVALINAFPVIHLKKGRAIIDIDDANCFGEYERLSFSCPLPKSALITDSYYVDSIGYLQLKASIIDKWVPWESRINSVFWRGSTTGIQASIPPLSEWNWRWLPRLHLCDIARQSSFSDYIDIGITNITQVNGEVVHDTIVNSGFMSRPEPELDFLKYRYLIDIDGNANAWSGLFRAMLMGSCILKVSSPHGWKQWYYDRLIPGVHYLPLRSDLSDFDATVDWALSHPDQCADIGRRARQFATSMVYEDEVDLSGSRLASLLASSCA